MSTGCVGRRPLALGPRPVDTVTACAGRLEHCSPELGPGAVTENRRNGVRVNRVMMMIGEEAEEESERAIIVKVKHRPELPNQEEVDQHFAANHVPFRPWCKHCVMGRSDGNVHRKSKNHDQQEVITVSCDYGYMTSEVKHGEKEEDESGNPRLFMVDSW